MEFWRVLGKILWWLIKLAAKILALLLWGVLRLGSIIIEKLAEWLKAVSH